MKAPLSKVMKTIKYLLSIFNLLFLICGLTLIVIGVILNIQFKDYFEFTGETSFGAVAIFIIILGLVISFISFFGCCGGFKENRCMVLTFSSFLIVTFFIEVAIIFVGIALKDRVYIFLQNDMLQSINSTKPGVMRTWNLIQKEFDCCGFNGPSDWKMRGIRLPESCCKNQYKCPSEMNPAYVNGCYETLLNWTTNNLSVIAFVALVVSIIQIFGTTLSCLLARSIKKGYQLVTH